MMHGKTEAQKHGSLFGVFRKGRKLINRENTDRWILMGDGPGRTCAAAANFQEDFFSFRQPGAYQLNGKAETGTAHAGDDIIILFVQGYLLIGGLAD